MCYWFTALYLWNISVRSIIFLKVFLLIQLWFLCVHLIFALIDAVLYFFCLVVMFFITRKVGNCSCLYKRDVCGLKKKIMNIKSKIECCTCPNLFFNLPSAGLLKYLCCGKKAFIFAKAVFQLSFLIKLISSGLCCLRKERYFIENHTLWKF